MDMETLSGVGYDRQINRQGVSVYHGATGTLFFFFAKNDEVGSGAIYLGTSGNRYLWVGCTDVCSLFKRWNRHPLELFFIGMIALTTLELLSSYLCEWMLYRQYWDYSAQFLNFQVHICLSSALAWCYALWG